MRKSSVRAQCEMRKSFSAADRNFPTRASFIGAFQRPSFSARFASIVSGFASIFHCTSFAMQRFCDTCCRRRSISYFQAAQREGFTHHSFNGLPRPLVDRRRVPVSYTSPVAASSLMRGARASVVTSHPFASSRVVWGPWTRRRRIISERNAALHLGSFVS